MAVQAADKNSFASWDVFLTLSVLAVVAFNVAAVFKAPVSHELLSGVDLAACGLAVPAFLYHSIYDKNPPSFKKMFLNTAWFACVICASTLCLNGWVSTETLGWVVLTPLIGSIVALGLNDMYHHFILNKRFNLH